MFKELIRANDGSTYETSNTVLLLDMWEMRDKKYDEIEDEIREHYTTRWCECSHDCCGHWRTSVGLVAIDLWNAVVHLHHTQNV